MNCQNSPLLLALLLPLYTLIRGHIYIKEGHRGGWVVQKMAIFLYLSSENVLTQVGGWFKKGSKHPYVIKMAPNCSILLPFYETFIISMKLSKSKCFLLYKIRKRFGTIVLLIEQGDGTQQCLENLPKKEEGKNRNRRRGSIGKHPFYDH